MCIVLTNVHEVCGVLFIQSNNFIFHGVWGVFVGFFLCKVRFLFKMCVVHLHIICTTISTIYIISGPVSLKSTV